jgi:anti-repressor protein
MKALLEQSFNGHSVRVFGTAENPLFSAADVCQILGILNARDAASSLEEDEKITVANPDGNPRAGIPHQFSCVTESGLYAMIFKSRKPDAKSFRKWVTSEVLPAIRRTGGYQVQAPRTYAEALRALADQAEALEKANAERALVLRENESMAPKAAFFDCAMTSKDTVLIRDAAKLLHPHVNGGMGEKRLFAWMHANKWLFGENKPYQTKVDAGLMRMTERPIPTNNHGTIIKTTPRLTQKGLVALHRQLVDSFGGDATAKLEVGK